MFMYIIKRHGTRSWRGASILLLTTALWAVGASNAYAASVATPTFSMPAGLYPGSTSVAISCSTSGATIRYTLDGKNPTSSSPVYSSAVSVTSTKTLKAKAFKPGMSDSGIASTTYTITIPLQAGDVLMYMGSDFGAIAIVGGEMSQLGTSAKYCHTGMYLGLDARSKIPYVGEMLGGGWTMRTLADSVTGESVDAYRVRGITASQGKTAAARAIGYGNPKVPYAYCQIAVFGVAGTRQSLTTIAAAIAAATTVQQFNCRSQMICSEMVRWALEDAGLNLASYVKYWPTLNRFLATDGLRHDYTSPNGLYLGGALSSLGRVK